VDSGFAVLHPHLRKVFHLPLGFALETVGFHPHLPWLLINAWSLSYYMATLGGTLAKNPLSLVK
jgi:hypothetical protein